MAANITEKEFDRGQSGTRREMRIYASLLALCLAALGYWGLTTQSKADAATIKAATCEAKMEDVRTDLSRMETKLDALLLRP